MTKRDEQVRAYAAELAEKSITPPTESAAQNVGEIRQPVYVGELLRSVDSDLANEWRHMQFYLYHASAIAGLHAHEYKEFFTNAAKSEMMHVQQFLDCLFGLGYNAPPADRPPPAAGLHLYTHVADALIYAHNMEREVVRNYTERLEQISRCDDPVTAKYLEVFYEQQLQDSFEDAMHLRRLLGGFQRPGLEPMRYLGPGSIQY